jgi:nucleoside-diphosphate-sugar epimerase
MKPTLLITGANGFVGKALCKEAIQDGHPVVTLTRKPFEFSGQNQNLVLDNYADCASISDELKKTEVIIHLAARVHVMNDVATNALEAYRKVNVENTLALAKAAAAARVKRFIYLSSVKVNGEETSLGKPFTADDAPAPQDPYGVSKLEAEQALLELSKKTDMEVVIIRPPLVYGPGVVANFAAMIKVVSRRIPLPLGAISNKRSMVSIGNLVDLILLCAQHPAAPGQVFLASDDHDVSLPELLRKLGNALGVPARLIAVPVSAIWFFASLLGKRNVAQRLCSSLQLDISKTKYLLAWKPPVSIDQGLLETAQWFKNQQLNQESNN